MWTDTEQSIMFFRPPDIAAFALPVLVATAIRQTDRLSDVTADTTILSVLEPGPLSTVSAVLFLIRNTATTVTCNNPLYQSLEEQLDIPKGKLKMFWYSTRIPAYLVNKQQSSSHSNSTVTSFSSWTSILKRHTRT